MKSIRAKIMWLLFGSVLISSLIIGMLGIALTYDVIQESTTENMRLLCRNNADKVDMTFTKVEESVNTLAHYVESELPDLQSLKDRAFREAFSAEVQKNALHHIESASGAAAIYLHYDPTFIGKTDGFYYVKGKEDEEFRYQELTDILAYPPDDSAHVGWWYVPTIKGEPTWFESYYDANLGRDIISYVVPLYRGGQLIGVIGADISAEYVVDQVKEVSIFRSGQAAVLKSDGTVLYHPNFDRGVLLGAGDPGFDGVIDHLKKGDTTELISYRLKGEKKKLASCKLRNGMLMICFAPEAEIYRQQTMLTQGNILITILVVVITSLIGIWMSRRIARPIKKLNEAAKRLSNGEFDFDLKVETRDEVAELTSTFMETRRILQNQIHLLDKEAHRDGLTGVGNKSAFMDREVELNREIAEGTADFSVAVFDVNKLKVANDVFGHMAGDRLLMTVAAHLAEVFGPQNVYRMGGDEFVAVLSESEEAEREEKISACIEGMKHLSVEGFPDCPVSFSCGASRFNKGPDHQLSDVLRRADKEMYKNKSETKRESFPWQEGAKGIKQLQVEKYGELLKSLKGSLDDYLFMMNLETGDIRFFGGNDSAFNIAEGQELSDGVMNILRYVHPNDYTRMRNAIEAVVKRDTEEMDLNFRMVNGKNIYWVNCRANIIKDEADSHFLLIGRISQNAVKHLYNPVTTLFNKAMMKQELRGEMQGRFSALMLMDIDNLSEINLKHGSVYGEGLLKELAAELEGRFSMWRIYHVEKDRFVALLDLKSSKEIEALFEEIKEAVSGKFTISAAVVSNDPYIYINSDNIYDYAVQVLNDSRKDGNGHIAFFSSDSFMERLLSVELLEEFEESVKNHCEGFYLLYQPQINAEDYSIYSAEALLRFTSKTKGAVYPDQFIPVLEQSGLINEVGLWVADEALRQCKEWRRYNPEFRVSVNVSAKQLEKRGSALQIINLLAKHGLPGDALILEVTESVQLEEHEDGFAALSKFREAGIQIAIDDFGTGYSNLGNLKQIHSSILKVDRCFVQDIKINGYNYNLIYNILAFAKTNSLKVCLEGVENKEELMVLSSLTPDYLQGYLFDRPCTVEELEEKYFRAESEKYAKRVEEIEQLHLERRHAPLVNMEMKTILRGLDIGLWILRIQNKDMSGELYADQVMRELLGADEEITSDECFEYWKENIVPEDRPKVSAMIEEMAKTENVVQVVYRWKHPRRGELLVRGSGRCTGKNTDTLVFEGFHRVVSD